MPVEPGNGRHRAARGEFSGDRLDSGVAGPAARHDTGDRQVAERVFAGRGRRLVRRFPVWLIGPLRRLVIADYHRQLAARATRCRARYTAAGLHTGGVVPYGYRLHPVLTDTDGQLRAAGRLVADPRTAPAVAAMFTRRVKDLLGDTDIGRRLAANPHHYPAPGTEQPRTHQPHALQPDRPTRQWRPHRVRAILTHPRYAGRRGAPALVDPEVFDAAQHLVHQVQRRAERVRRATITNSATIPATIYAADHAGGPARPDNAQDTP